MSYRPRSTRKRKANVNDSNDLRHWTKDKYVKLLSEKSIEVDIKGKVDIVRQLYLANTNTAVKRTRYVFTVYRLSNGNGLCDSFFRVLKMRRIHRSTFIRPGYQRL